MLLTAGLKWSTMTETKLCITFKYRLKAIKRAAANTLFKPTRACTYLALCKSFRVLTLHKLQFKVLSWILQASKIAQFLPQPQIPRPLLMTLSSMRPTGSPDSVYTLFNQLSNQYCMVHNILQPTHSNMSRFVDLIAKIILDQDFEKEKQKAQPVDLLHAATAVSGMWCA